MAEKSKKLKMAATKGEPRGKKAKRSHPVVPLVEPVLNPAFSKPAMRKDLATSLQSESKEFKSPEAVISHYPFTSCVLHELLQPAFIDALQHEVEEMDFLQKSNDLYSFEQTLDLNNCDLPNVAALRTFLYDTWLPWMREVSGIDLEPKCDMFASRYTQTDVLLCHDDELEGRRIAYILYLVPSTWDSSCGGGLDLFDTNESKTLPRNVVGSIVPKRGTLAFFPVSLVSHHQVGEVLCAEKVRYALTGWFYGPPIDRPPLVMDPLPVFMPAKNADKDEGDQLGEWLEWIDDNYLDLGNVAQISDHIENESHIQLANFMKKEKYDVILEELKALPSSSWTSQGPPNRRHYSSLNSTACETSPTLAQFLSFIESASFFQYLEQLTELELRTFSGQCRRFQHGDYTLMHDADTSFSFEALDVCFYFLDDAPNSSDKQSEPSSSSKKNSQLKKGKKTKSPPAEPMFDENTGGYTAYVAKDEEEELLTIAPQGNALTLVFREKDVMKFVKFINCRAKSSFFDVMYSYRE